MGGTEEAHCANEDWKLFKLDNTVCVLALRRQKLNFCKGGITVRSHFNEERMFTYVKGFAMGCKLPETLKALNYARKLHKGQYRKSGEPYIIHPLTMVCQAISLGIENDIILSAILLHDVVEDCNVSVNDLPCNEEVKKTVNLLQTFMSIQLVSIYMELQKHSIHN